MDGFEIQFNRVAIMHTESEDIAAALFGSVDKRIVWWKVGGFWFNWNFGDTDGWVVLYGIIESSVIIYF